MALYSRGSARRSLIDTVAFRAASQAATLLGYVVLVRGMTKQDFGVFSLLYALIPVFGMAVSFGLEQVLRRYQPEYLSAGNTVAASWLVRIVARGRFGLNIVVLGAILLSWEHVAPFFHLGPYRGAFVIFAALTLLHFQLGILQMAMASRMLHRLSVGATALLSIAKLVCYGALYWHGSLTLRNAILADTLAYGAAFLVLHLAYRRQLATEGGEKPYRPEPAERKRLVRYGLFNSFNDAGVLLMSSTLDNFFIAAVIDVISVGIFSFYLRLNQMAQNLMPQRLFDNVVQPMFFAIIRSEAGEKIPKYFTFLLNMNLMLQWPIFAFALVYHSDIVTVIFAGRFVEYSWLLPLVVGFATLNAVADPASIVAQYEEKAEVLLLSKVFSLYNLAAMFVLVPLLGILGAVLASGSAQTFKNAFIWWHVRGNARWLNAWPALAGAIVLWGSAVLLGSGIRSHLPVPAVVHLVIGVFLLGATLLVHVRTGIISASDRSILAALMGGKEARLLRHLGLMPRAAGQGATRS
ncbi:MAG: lipopolysaccharide biosynthesis protein [Pseudomonadota bacterium]